MKPHPRIRTAIKWGGAAVTVLLVVVWIGSGWWNAGFVTHHGSQGWVTQGTIGFGKFDIVGYEDLSFRHLSPERICKWQWWFYSIRNPSAWLLVIPLWTLLLPSATCTVMAWRLDGIASRRARLRLCPKCGYDPTGLAAGTVCPECGAAPAATQTRAVKPPPRIRKAIKWGGLALCLLLAGVWVRSEWVCEGYGRGHWAGLWCKGMFCIEHSRLFEPKDGYSRTTENWHTTRLWWPGTLQWSLKDWWVVPLWMPLALMLLATAAAWRLDTLARGRARAPFCRKCHYDRTGLAASAKCPECGALPSGPEGR